jgi:mono/diheme cytochrome c family protein
MSSTKVKFIVLILIAGLLSACGGQTVDIPTSTSQPTEEVVSATEAPTNIPVVTDISEPAVAGAGVSFANDILPMLESRCITCHGGDRIEEGLVLKTHSDIMAGSENGSVVTPGDAANSLLAELVLAQKMPKRGPKLTPPQVQLIIDWINQGALNN